MACPVKPDNDTGKVNLGREFPENRENNGEFFTNSARFQVILAGRLKITQKFEELPGDSLFFAGTATFRRWNRDFFTETAN
jgi:hypothetical protein